MNPKFRILYIVAGALAMLLAIYKAVITYPAVAYGLVAFNVFMSIFFFYLAYKTYHEKKDNELM